ncbi:unnamed protein product [Caenorhabditis auriculariae]|uniref:BSD domain-containing protein n=1 Tax=Caenorhabditis auriculariae TaxID=2777116 RepID=A0A8S1HTJ5_9PELO|nr:unnamed protein product [Caenorhabditis auriculariae]
MSWLLGDLKKRVNDAKNTIEQSFQSAANNMGDEEEKKVVEEKSVEEKEENIEPSENEKNSGDANVKSKVSSLFGGMSMSTNASKLFEYAKDATKKLEEVKNAVIENTMLGELNKEQNDFENQLNDGKNKQQVELPWQGLPDENLARKQIMSLSSDTRNFLRDSPGNLEFSFDQQQAMAAILIKEDPNLAKVRFQLVPKQVKEDNFWRNYFYRVGLIRQSALARASSPPPLAAEPSTNPEKETELTPQSVEKAEEKVEETASSATGSASEDSSEESTGKKSDEEDEIFISEPYGDVKTSTLLDDEWEKEILADLNEYEVVAEKSSKDEEAWEAEIQKILSSE